MALSQVYTAVAGHVITAARWNNEFGNIYANGTDLAFPLTKAVSLAGWTLTLDNAGATTLLSTASTGISYTPGAKSGTPSVNGSFFNMLAATFTDTNTAAAGTATQWNAFSLRAPTLAATNAGVITTDAATLKVEAPIQGSNETLTNSWAAYLSGKLYVSSDTLMNGVLEIKVDGAQTNSVLYPLTVQATTSGSPDVGIGTGIYFQSESADETPSDIGKIHFAFSDKTSTTEDSYFSLLTRTAGAALAESYRFVSVDAFKSTFTHTLTADRTITLPDRNVTLGGADIVSGPTSTGSGSTIAHEGTVSDNDVTKSGIHYYTNYTLNVSKTLSVAAQTHRIVIIASNSITINGTIDANVNGAGAVGGAGGGGGGAPGNVGSSGFSQPGGGGGTGIQAGAVGGSILMHGIVRAAGGAIGTAGTQQSGSNLANFDPTTILGGAGGGGGGDGGGPGGGAGGAGGGSIVLIAPSITLGAASVLKTSGVAGTAGGAAADGAGGGGGAGNILIMCRSFTDSGCTYTLTGGAGGVGPGGNGGAGAGGVKQINIYA